MQIDFSKTNRLNVGTNKANLVRLVSMIFQIRDSLLVVFLLY